MTSNNQIRRGLKMRIAAYRELIDACYSVLNSVKSAATSHEQRLEVGRLENAYKELAAAQCRCHTNDQIKVANCLLDCQKMINDKRSEFKQADAMLQRMAFGKF
jgi:hypothetical protein